MSILLEVNRIIKRFGGLIALDQVDIKVEEGQIFGLIGPNGAGKTTLFNIISGFYSPTSGKVIFGKSDITGKNPEQLARVGIARTFQNTMLFDDWAVLQNVVAAHYLHANSSIFDNAFKQGVVRNTERMILEKSLELLEEAGLTSYKDELARNLPYGYQRKLSICMALAVKPRLLLLDEPAAGMNLQEIEDLTSLIARIREKGVTIMLIEHNMKAVMGLCNYIAVLNFGRKIAEGIPSVVANNSDVIEAYLGKGDISA